MAYERLHGPLLVHERVDLGFASLAFILIKLLGDPKRTRSLKIGDCLPPYMVPARPEGQDAATLGAILESWARRDAVSQR